MLKWPWKYIENQQKTLKNILAMCCKPCTRFSLDLKKTKTTLKNSGKPEIGSKFCQNCSASGAAAPDPATPLSTN